MCAFTLTQSCLSTKVHLQTIPNTRKYPSADCNIHFFSKWNPQISTVPSNLEEKMIVKQRIRHDVNRCMVTWKSLSRISRLTRKMWPIPDHPLNNIYTMQLWNSLIKKFRQSKHGFEAHGKRNVLFKTKKRTVIILKNPTVQSLNALDKQ